MKHIPLTSRSGNVQSAAYDEDSHTLEIAFQNGVYAYQGVPRNVFLDLLLADSPGSYIARYIKPNYRGVLVDS